MKNVAIAVFGLAVLVLPAAALAAPVITLTGGSVSFQQGSSYQEPGYSASDAVDGDLTSFVSVINNILANVPGSYHVNYSVTNSASETTDATRSVEVIGFGGMADPCTYNGSCPCPINGDPITGDPKALKSCMVAKYPKLTDGSTLVCRLRPLFPDEIDAHSGVQCAKDQAGFGVMKILPNGTEITL